MAHVLPYGSLCHDVDQSEDFRSLDRMSCPDAFRGESRPDEGLI